MIATKKELWDHHVLQGLMKKEGGNVQEALWPLCLKSTESSRDCCHRHAWWPCAMLTHSFPLQSSHHSTAPRSF